MMALFYSFTRLAIIYLTSPQDEMLGTQQRVNTDSTFPQRAHSVTEGDKQTGQLNLQLGTRIAGPHRTGCREVRGQA